MGRDTLFFFLAILLTGCGAQANGSAADRIEGVISSVEASTPLPQVRVSIRAAGEDGRHWNGIDTTNYAGRFVIDALTSPEDFSSSLLHRDTEYELKAEVEGYWVHRETISFNRRVHGLDIELKPKRHDEVDSGGGAQEHKGTGTVHGASPKKG